MDYEFTNKTKKQISLGEKNNKHIWRLRLYFPSMIIHVWQVPSTQPASLDYKCRIGATNIFLQCWIFEGDFNFKKDVLPCEGLLRVIWYPWLRRFICGSDWRAAAQAARIQSNVCNALLHPELSDISNCCDSNKNWSWKSELCLSYNLYVNVSNLIVLPE